MPDFSTQNGNSIATIPVTALLPVKNGMKYISRARRQVASTCRDKDEIIIVDDNSTDGTFAELEKWASQDHRVRILKNPGDGLVSALNLGIRESTNNWIARFDVDDTYNFERIQKQTNMIQPNVVAVFSDYEVLWPSGKSLGVIPSPVDPDAVDVSLVSSRRTPHPSVLFLKDAVISVGGYLPQDFPAEDLSLWLRLSREGLLKSTPEVLLGYELGVNSVSGQKRELIQRKTSSLIRDIGIRSSSLNSAHQRFDEILNSYNHLKYGFERQILFTQELSKALKIAGKSTSTSPMRCLVRRLEFDLIRAGMNISADTIKRRMYRKLG